MDSTQRTKHEAKGRGRRNFLTGAATLAIAVSYLICSASHIPAQQNPDLLVSFKLNSPSLTLHEPVLLTFEARNTSARAIGINLGRNRRANFEIFLTPPNASSIEIHPPTVSGFNRVGDIIVEPGQNYTQKLILSEWFDFEAVGNYPITATLRKEASVQYTSPHEGSFRGVLEIKPRDVPKLSRTCEDLAKQVETSNDYEESSEAATELSYVRDEVAVPSLRRVLFAGRLVEPIAIAGLERIADREAIGALGDALESKVRDTPALARAALYRLQNQLADRDRLGQIRKILQVEPPKSGIQD